MITSPPQRPPRGHHGVGVVAPNGIGNGPWWSATTAAERHRSHHPLRPVALRDAVRRRGRGFAPSTTSSGACVCRPTVDVDGSRGHRHGARRRKLPARRPRPVLDERHPASSSGGNEFGQVEIRAVVQGRRACRCLQSIAGSTQTTGQISIRYGLKGASGVVVSRAPAASTPSRRAPRGPARR